MCSLPGAGGGVLRSARHFAHPYQLLVTWLHFSRDRMTVSPPPPTLPQMLPSSPRPWPCTQMLGYRLEQYSSLLAWTTRVFLRKKNSETVLGDSQPNSGFKSESRGVAGSQRGRGTPLPMHHGPFCLCGPAHDRESLSLAGGCPSVGSTRF